MAEALIEGEAQDIIRAMINKAKDGDSSAMKLCVERLIPVRKGRPVTFELPPVETPSVITKALGTVAKGMAEGELTPDEATMIGSVIEMKRRAIETVELEQRLRALGDWILSAG